MLALDRLQLFKDQGRTPLRGVAGLDVASRKTLRRRLVNVRINVCIGGDVSNMFLAGPAETFPERRSAARGGGDADSYNRPSADCPDCPAANCTLEAKMSTPTALTYLSAGGISTRVRGIPSVRASQVLAPRSADEHRA